MLAQFVERFQSGAISRREWTHAAHLQVGAWYVHHWGPEAALTQLRAAICHLNERHGTPNDDHHGYHETITRAYVELLSRWLSRFDAAVPISERVTELLRSPFARSRLLLEYWSPEVLFSVPARRAWVPPDRAPLDLPRS